MSPHRRSPRPLASVLARVQVDLAPQTLLGEVQQRWPDVVGELIAAQAEPTAERAGVLTVSCAAAVWAQELDLMGPVVLERLGQVLTRGKVRRLRCVTLPPPSPR